MSPASSTKSTSLSAAMSAGVRTSVIVEHVGRKSDQQLGSVMSGADDISDLQLPRQSKFARNSDLVTAQLCATAALEHRSHGVKTFTVTTRRPPLGRYTSVVGVGRISGGGTNERRAKLQQELEQCSRELIQERWTDLGRRGSLAEALEHFKFHLRVGSARAGLDPLEDGEEDEALQYLDEPEADDTSDEHLPDVAKHHIWDDVIKNDIANADVVVVMGLSGLVVDLTSWAYVTAHTRLDCKFVLACGWKKAIVMSAGDLQQHAIDPALFFDQDRSATGESDEAVLFEGFQSCTIHRRLAATGVSSSHERQRHHLLKAGGYGFAEAATDTVSPVACVMGGCEGPLYCSDMLSMVLHLSRCHHRALRLLGVDEGDIWNWCYHRLGEGAQAQRDLRPSGQQRERELIMSAGAQYAARKAELEVSKNKAKAKQVFEPKPRSLLGSSTALVPSGNCSFRDSFCKQGEHLQADQWTAEAIADHYLTFHQRRQHKCRWSRGDTCRGAVGMMKRDALLAHLEEHIRQATTGTVPQAYMQAMESSTSAPQGSNKRARR